MPLPIDPIKRNQWIEKQKESQKRNWLKNKQERLNNMPQLYKKGCKPLKPFKKGHITHNKGLKGFLAKEQHYRYNPNKIESKYQMVYMPSHPFTDKQGYINNSRLVMEDFISNMIGEKYYLNKKQIVHHINGIKNDNRTGNLLLFKNQAKHVEFHHLQEKIKQGGINCLNASV